MTRLILGICFVVLVGSISHAADLPATAPATTLPFDSDAVRLFRLRATESDSTIRLAAKDVEMDAESLASLTKVLDAYLARVEAEVEVIRRDNPGIRRVIERATELQKAFAAGPLVEWSKANPHVRKLIEDRSNLWLPIFFTLSDVAGQKKLVAAALKAGLPASREAEASEIVERAYQALLKQMQIERFVTDTRLAGMPDGETRELAMAVITAEQPGKMFHIGRSVYNELRTLLNPDQFEAFDRAMPRVGW